jgi:hypothetical protein
MQSSSSSANSWRVGIDLAVLLSLAAVAGVAAALTLAGIAIVLTGVGGRAPDAVPQAPVHAPAARTMVADQRDQY